MPDIHYSERDDQVFPELYRKQTAKPEPGAVVKLKLRDTSCSIFKKEFFEINGKVIVLRDPAFADSFGVWVGDEDPVPQREVRLSRVYELNGKRVEFAPPKEAKKRLPELDVTVTGSKGDLYRVSGSEGRYVCTCKGFGFRGTCRHLGEALAGVRVTPAPSKPRKKK